MAAPKSSGSDLPTHEDILLQLFSKMDSLPVLPDLYLKVTEEAQRPFSSTTSISKVISRDLAVTAKIIKLVNSASFGLKKKILSVKDAVTYIGLETVKSIIIATNAFEHFSDEDIQEFNIDKIFNHSVKTGALAGNIMKVVHKEQKLYDASVMAGMLHDVGKVVYIANMKQEYRKVVAMQKKSGQPMYQVEKELFGGVTHSDMGAYLIETWNLPENVCTAISEHHRAVRAFGGGYFNVSAAVYIANQFTHIPENKNGKTVDWLRRDKTYLDSLGLQKYITEWETLAANA